MAFFSGLAARIKALLSGGPDYGPADSAYGDSGLSVVPTAERSRAATREDTLPQFRVSAIDRPDGPGDVRATRIRMRLRDVFTPAQPVTDRRLFAGRLQVLATLIEIIEERLAHVVVFGERGIGKTSTLHVLAELAEASRYRVVRATCGADTEFVDAFRAITRRIPLYYMSDVSPTDAEAEQGASVADRLPAGNFGPRELSGLLARITGTRVLIFLDEYDRIESADFRRAIAELIKDLSDSAARVQLVLAGVASNLHELIGHIPSIRRNVVGVPMPRLTDREVDALVALGEEHSGIAFDDAARGLVRSTANGSPYMARLVCHHASLAALDAGRTAIGRADVEQALDRMVEEAEGRLEPLTIRHVADLDMSQGQELLGGLARAAGTADGVFGVTELEASLPPPMVAQATALLDGDLARRGLLEAVGEGEERRYRFRDEGFANYLWIQVARARHGRVATPKLAQPA